MNTLRWPSYVGATLAVLVALVSYRFLFLDLSAAFPDMLGHIAERPLAFALHIVASPVALALGLLQFSSRLRSRRPAVHRWSGRAYALAVLAGGLAGLILAPGVSGGPVAAWGFGLLAVIWIAVTGQAVRSAMAARFVAHRRWMIRSYALTFGAVTFRLYLPLFFGLGGMDYAQASVWIAWLSWLPNLLLAEWWLAREGRAARAIS